MIEFRTDGSPIEIDETYQEIGKPRYGKKLLSNGVHAVEIVVGKKRDRFLGEYDQAHPQKPEPTITQAVTELAATSPAVDVREENGEFSGSAEIGKIFVPDSRDWFECTFDSKRHNAIIGKLSNDALVWCHEMDFTLKHFGHSLCLDFGTRFAVRMELNPEKNKFAYRALEAQILDTEQQRGTHMTGEILNWRGTLGGARMKCGCSIGVGTADRDDQLDLNPGDIVEFDITWYEKKQKFIGVNVRLKDNDL